MTANSNTTPVQAEQEKVAAEYFSMQAAAQDYWLQAMTVGDRTNVLESVAATPAQRRSMKHLHGLCMDYVATHFTAEVKAHAAKLQAELDAIIAPVKPAKTAANYLYNLNEIPAANRALFDELNAAIEKAFAKVAKGDKSLTRHNAGYIAVTAEGELVEIQQYLDDAPDGLYGWWMVSEYKSAWYGDPRPTLKAVRESVGV